MPTVPTPGQVLERSLATAVGREVTFIFSSGVEFPCTLIAVQGGLVHFETPFSEGTLLMSSFAGFAVDKI